MSNPGRTVMHGNDPRIEENASAKLARKRAEAQRAADALNDRRADTTTPLEAPDAAEQAEDKAKPAPAIILSFQTIYRSRLITITGEHMSLDQFCDLLDKRLGAAS
jgi:hypothetical protein